MPWCNVLQRTGPDFCATDNIPCTFDNFRLTILPKERISTYVDPCAQNPQL